jgi:hypothetical protein
MSGLCVPNPIQPCAIYKSPGHGPTWPLLYSCVASRPLNIRHNAMKSVEGNNSGRQRHGLGFDFLSGVDRSNQADALRKTATYPIHSVPDLYISIIVLASS